MKLSKSLPVPPLLFLLGELPVEARLHIDLLTLFHNAGTNRHTKLFQVLKHILMLSDEKSTTWAVHIRLVSQLYELPVPLMLIQSNPMSKATWISNIVTKITAFHERGLRKKAANNSFLKYLNVELLGLSGKPYPVLQGISETRQAVKFRAHIYSSYEVIFLP